MLIKIATGNADESIKKAVELLNKGGIIAFPTETFYGLGVRFDNEDSLRKLYELKKRPKEKPMPLIIGFREMLSHLSESSDKISSELMNRFWPGPLTLLLKAKKSLSRYLTADTGKVAVRIPGESIALQIAKAAGFPITATSANISGMPPATNTETIIKYFPDKLDMIIDGGQTSVGMPSTIVDITDDNVKILREGAIPASVIYNFIKKEI